MRAASVKRLLATCVLPRRERDEILLTFDDGPDPDGTPAVLEVLRRHSARAVFFVVGSRIPRAPWLLRRILDEGHVIGNHSFAHPLDRQFGAAACFKDLRQCQDVVRHLTGVEPTLFRPPLGQVSFASLCAPRLAGLTPMFWSVDSGDWRLRTESDVREAAVTFRAAVAHRGLREIALFHDENRWTSGLLELILPELVARQVSLRPSLAGHVPSAEMPGQ